VRSAIRRISGRKAPFRVDLTADVPMETCDICTHELNDREAPGTLA